MDWSTYDRVATAAANMRFLMFEMQAGAHVLGPLVCARDTTPSREDLRAAMGPLNYERAREYLDCVAVNVKKMGSIGLSFATTVMTVMDQSTDPAVAPILDRVRALMSKDDVNGAWNLVEAWACRRELLMDDDDGDKHGDAPEVLP